MDNLFSFPSLPRHPNEPNVPLPAKLVKLYATMLDVRGFDCGEWFDTDSELVRCALPLQYLDSLISLGCIYHLSAAWQRRPVVHGSSMLCAAAPQLRRIRHTRTACRMVCPR